MSENSGTSAPAAPAAPAAAQPATPAPATNQNVVNAPAPASQESISLSDAGRLLARRRQEAAREAQGQPTARLNPVQQGPGEARATPAPAQPAAQPTEAKAAPTDSYDTIAKALGLQEGAQPAAPDGTAPAADASESGIYEIDGHRVTAAQIRTAMGMAADYTRKTQELAAQRQQLQQQAEALATVLPHIQPELAKLGERLQGATPPDPSLIESDPQGYLRQFAAYQQATAEQQRLGSLTQLQQQAFERAMTQQVEAGNKMLSEKYEFWRDDAQRTTVQRDIARWAESKGGYTRQELQGLSDPRHVESMMKAMMFDRLVEGAKTRAPQPVQTAQARGVRPPPAAAAQVQQAEQAFEARPNARNAAALLSARRSNANGSTRY
jgi:hypothetical protein